MLKMKKTIAYSLIIVVLLSTVGCVESTENVVKKDISELETPEFTEIGDNSNLDEEVQSDTKESLGENSDDSIATGDVDESLDDGVVEDDGLTDEQRNSLNMLNYISVLTQEINSSKNSRLYLESAYSKVLNNTYLNAVDPNTKIQLGDILDTLENYRMITVKRERLEYIYQRNQAKAIRQAIPNPVGLLSAVESGNMLKTAASVLYMAVDSKASYDGATDDADFQYLQDGWALDDEEAAYLHESRTNLFDYMIDMTNNNGLPADYVLTNDAVERFVEWSNKDNASRRIDWLKENKNTYKEYGPYWLELAKSYYEMEEYEESLATIEKYEEINTRIFKKDYEYAKTLSIGIVAAKEAKSEEEYINYASEKADVILNNVDEDDCITRYYVAQVYLDLAHLTGDDSYIQKAYNIAYNNVNVLVDEQRRLNEEYLSDVEEVEIDKKDSKRIKEEKKKYNKLLKEERKVALPPVNDIFYQNCELLFELADELGIDSEEKNRIDLMLHDKDNLFLNSVLDNKFKYSNKNTVSEKNIEITFDGEELIIPASYVTENAIVTISVTRDGKTTTFDDLIVTKVKRSDTGECDDFAAYFHSDSAKKYKYLDGDSIVINVSPMDAMKETLTFKYKAVEKKTLYVISGIKFERK